MRVRVLVALSNRAQQRRFEELLETQHSLVTELETPGELWARLAGERFDLLLVSHSALPQPAIGSIGAIRALPDAPDVLVVSDREDPEERARVLAAGGLAVIYSGLDDSVIGDTLASLMRRHREDAIRRFRTREEGPRLGDFVSASLSMQDLLAVARRVVASDTSLLILGQTGVGKEWLARAIHEEGPRAAGPFIAINCGAIAETLLESELFGHEEGAFTGARRAHRGYFELAHQGTIFLDEIAE
ncbi:MAG: sigma 54-interacting transcriptional regulator, partial [Candidatus Eisenbacteria bacterium]|nr:sigma 54-interacting transcriptional regulator [Candidatus Eisenbacteria bacterium]